MSILSRKYIPLDVVLDETLFILLQISEIPEFDNTGKRTGRTIGFAYDVVDTKNFDRFRVKIKSQAIPLMPIEKLTELRDNGDKVAVEFVHPTVYMYWDGNKKSYADSFAADDVRLVELED